MRWSASRNSVHLASAPTTAFQPIRVLISTSHFDRPLKSKTGTAIAARRSRPFQGKTQVEEETLTEDELLTDSYLASLGDEAWAEDPPGHRAGTTTSKTVTATYIAVFKGRHLQSSRQRTRPASAAGYVAIVGRPNAGKSTLVNALVGQKLSIVTAKAQTTRHRILSLVNEPDSQMILLDTPGIMTVRRITPCLPLSKVPAVTTFAGGTDRYEMMAWQTARNKLDARMMKSVWQAARDADALLAIVDSSLHPKEDLDSLNQVFEASEARKLPIALVSPSAIPARACSHQLFACVL